MGSEYHNEDFDVEAQQAARDAIMEIPLFPDLTVQLRDALEYGPHCDMLQHFVYWFHLRHPKMQKRWTMYKTYTEWREECGLARKQVDKGRARLRELGLVNEKKGPHGRVHYQVDWVALAEDLSLSPYGEQTDEFDEWFDDDLDENSLSPYGEQGQFVPQGEQSSLSPYGEQANTGDYAGDYLTGNSTLQVAPEPVLTEPGAHEMNGKEEKDGLSSQPVDGQRHSQNGGTPSESRLERRETPTLSGDMKVKVWTLVSGRAEEQVVRRFADNHIWNRRDSEGEPFTIERVAEKAREVLQGEEPLDAYVPWVERLIEDRREEMTDAEKAVFEAVA